MVMALASEFILHGWHCGVIVKSQTNMLCSQVLCMQVEGNSDLSGLKPPLPQNEEMFSFFFSTQTEMDVKPVKQNKKSQFNSSVVWGVQSTCLKDLRNNRTPPIPQSVAANHTEVQLQVAG